MINYHFSVPTFEHVPIYFSDLLVKWHLHGKELRRRLQCCKQFKPPPHYLKFVTVPVFFYVLLSERDVEPEQVSPERVLAFR